MLPTILQKFCLILINSSILRGSLELCWRAKLQNQAIFNVHKKIVVINEQWPSMLY